MGFCFVEKARILGELAAALLHSTVRSGGVARCSLARGLVITPHYQFLWMVSETAG